MQSFDFVVVGAGIIGLTAAREIKIRWPDSSIAIFEKEKQVALHASGRNSGVLHAGFYYTPDSMKARLARDGNRMMHEYCDEHGLDINRCGKVVVASNQKELESLELLYQRGLTNGVELKWINSSELREIEPMAVTTRYAIYSPTTSSIDPVQVTKTMATECKELGIEIYFDEPLIQVSELNGIVKLKTRRNSVEARFLINAAGLHADKIAHQLGVGQQYSVQPFIGLYLRADKNPPKLRTHVYPVPDLRNPFLGVHFTKTVHNSVKIGPTATPALWREQYNFKDGFSFGEMKESLFGLTMMLARPKSSIRNSVIPELAKYYRPLLLRQAQRLVPNVSLEQFDNWSTPGIRAQLVDRSTWKLVNDFVIEKTPNTLHVLNAVSPAFTSSIPFAQTIVDQIDA